MINDTPHDSFRNYFPVYINFDTVYSEYYDQEAVLKNSPRHFITDEESQKLSDVITKVIQWHYDRNLIHGSDDKNQVLKLSQELGELSSNVCKGLDVSDDIGDMLVVMLNIVERRGLTLLQCLEKSWEEIKDRKGKMIGGIFVKESDLPSLKKE